MTRLDESSHSTDQHSQLLRFYRHAGDINRLHHVPSHRSTPAFLPKVIEATTTLLPLPCLPSGARALPPLGEDVVAARRVRPSRPASACSFFTLRLNLMLYSRDSSQFLRRRPFIYTAMCHRANPEFIGSRNCVLMAFTAESPPAQGQ